MTSNLVVLSLEEKEQIKIKFAVKGLFFALFSSLCWAVYGTLVSFIYKTEIFINLPNEYVGPLVMASLYASTASVLFLIYNTLHGKLKEIPRSLATRPGKVLCLGGVLGGPVALTGFMTAVSLCGPAYAMLISGTYPAISAIIARVVLKEKISKRGWSGIFMCIAGAIILGYLPPAGSEYPHFYLGMLFAVMAAVGWGTEGVLAAFGTDTIDSAVGATIRDLASATVFMFLIIPWMQGYSIYIAVVTNLEIYPVVVLAALFGSGALLYWYKAMGFIGVSRSTAINGTYGLWGLIINALLGSLGIVAFTMTPNLLVGALVVSFGIITVVINPRELLSLRDHE